MSVFSANSFAALGDGDDYTPQPAQKAAPAPAPPAAAAPARAQQQPRNNNGPRRDNRRGDRPDREVHADVPAGEGAKEDRAKSFARGGGRGGRASRGPGGNPRGNTGTYMGGNRPRRENGGGRPFDRMSQTGRTDTAKAEAAGWGAEDGKKELEAEQDGEKDAQAETPAEGAATPVVEAAPVDEEEQTQTYEEYLAAQAAKKLAIADLPEARKPNEGEDLFANAKVVPKKGETEEEWLFGAPKAASGKAKKQKEAKQFIEIEFASKAPRRDNDRPRDSARGGRGGARGRGEGRGEGRGRGGARGGAPRGQGRSQAAPAPAVTDSSAFPALA